MTVLLIILSVLSLWGLYCTGYFLRNLEFFVAFHKERQARKKVDGG
jgi:hypothetical protein